MERRRANMKSNSALRPSAGAWNMDKNGGKHKGMAYEF